MCCSIREKAHPRDSVSFMNSTLLDSYLRSSLQLRLVNGLLLLFAHVHKLLHRSDEYPKRKELT